MLRKNAIAIIGVLGVAVLGYSLATAQNYPAKPVRIVTGAIGTGSDITARIVAQRMSPSLGQQVIVDNRGAGVIPGDIVAKSPPDGYTLLAASGFLWNGPFLSKNVPYDPVRDFLPVSMANRAPQMLVVHPSLPAKSVKELIALAKARPGELSYSTGSTGSATHLAAELFKSMTGTKMVRIPYRSGAIEGADLLSGDVQLTFGSTSSNMPYVKAGRLRALAISTAQPSALAPGLPTIAASGVPGYESGVITGIFAPAGTPVAIISRLNHEVVRVFNMPETQELFLNNGVEAVGSSPEQFAAAIKADMAKWGKLIKEAGIHAD